MINRTNQRHSRLKELITSQNTLAVPGAYDALSAKIIEKTGFPAVYTGSYSTAASRFGLPDVGAISLTELIEHAKTIVDAVSIPVIADAENAGSHPENIWRIVQGFEKAGVSAIHIEDHEFGKHTSLPLQITDLDQMCKKIKAAVEAKNDPDFLIIARTDTPVVSGDMEEAVNRANAYLASGADLVFFAGTSPDMIKPVRHCVKGPIVITHSPSYTVQDESKAGVNLVIYYSLLLYAAYQAGTRVAEEFHRLQDFNQLQDWLADEKEFEEFIGYPLFIEKSKRYHKSSLN